jgi:hypothetical protein
VVCADAGADTPRPRGIQISDAATAQRIGPPLDAEIQFIISDLLLGIFAQGLLRRRLRSDAYF